MSKYTTERWFNEGGTVLDENRLPVAHVVGQEEDDSDAKLIAAAPEILCALRVCVSRLAMHAPTGNGDAIDAANQAIAAAEGRS
jgi:hypothetical protein